MNCHTFEASLDYRVSGGGREEGGGGGEEGGGRGEEMILEAGDMAQWQSTFLAGTRLWF